jgi:hypothetical protein
VISAELMAENSSLRFVVGLKALAASYDANGNMTLRLKDGVRYFLTCDAENRLTTCLYPLIRYPSAYQFLTNFPSNKCLQNRTITPQSTNHIPLTLIP